MNVQDELRRMLAERTEVPGDEPAPLSGTGRGPTGRLRNFRAMNDDKLAGVYEAVYLENDDPEAMAAVAKEVEAR